MNLLPVLTAALLASAQPSPERMPNKAQQKADDVALLKRNIFKVDRAILETEKLIAQSRAAPYLPDLQFRLAELYVEKSRYVYFLQAEQRPAGAKGALVSPETRLYKEKALQLYNRLLREHPDFRDADQVTFYLAHEQRELGQFDEMLKTLGELVRKYPQSPLRLDAEQILGDYFFDKSDLGEAEKHYQAILESPASPVHDLARYKMGWIRVNQGKHQDAVTYFEAAAASAPVPGADPQKSLNVKREALLDLVYSYTEVRPGKGAINYFEKLSDSRATFALALDKLGTRYFIKQQYELAVPAIRKLLELQSDPELDMERAEKLYDALKAAKGKILPEPEDVKALVRAAVEVKTNPDLEEPARKKTLAELEELSRDLATQLHVAAQKKDEDKLYKKSAQAYAEYLSLFRPEKYVQTMMRNRADALIAAKEYTQAARQFEELVPLTKEGPDRESALYGALLAHYSALQPEMVAKANAFEVADSRQALERLGAEYVAHYPKSDKAAEVKFNIARAHYDDGEFEKASELFLAFALSHPEHKDATVAGHLALDAKRQLADFAGLEAVGKKLLSAKLPQTFLAEVAKILSESKTEAIGELALKSSEETGDVVEGLLKVASENKSAEVGEKALYGAFTAAQEKHDLDKAREIGTKLVSEYPKSAYASPILFTLGRQAAELARYDEAAGFYEQAGTRLGQDSAALDGWLAAAHLRSALGDPKGAVKDLEQAADVAGSRKAEVFAELAQTHLKANDLSHARAAAEKALALDKQSAPAAAILAQAQATLSPDQKPDALIATLTAIAQGPNGQTEDTAKGIWYLAEILYRNLKKLPADEVEQKVALVQQLEGLYTQAASLGSAEYAVASLWRLGLCYQHLADTVETSPVPDGLTGADLQQFRAAVKQQVAPIKQRADSAFNACLSRAASLEVFTPAVLGCRKRLDEVPSPLPALAQGRGQVSDDLLRKVESTPDAPSFEALGQGFLEIHQARKAILALSRALELEENRASAQNALGYAFLLTGDAMEARAAYGKALDSDPTYAKARANLAALKCRFGDVEGAKRDAAVLHDKDLSGPDVDPEWRSCK